MGGATGAGKCGGGDEPWIAGAGAAADAWFSLRCARGAAQSSSMSLSELKSSMRTAAEKEELPWQPPAVF